jgi:hypothetical protein
MAGNLAPSGGLCGGGSTASGVGYGTMSSRLGEWWESRKRPAGGLHPELDDDVPPGWYDDPLRPGIQMYWDGDDYSDDVAPRPTPEPAYKQARVIALGILMALAVVFVVVRLLDDSPSETECAGQRLDYALGDRTFVDPECR